MRRSIKGSEGSVGRRLLVFLVLLGLAAGGYWYYTVQREQEVLRQIISRLSSEDRVAQVWVKEYVKDAQGKPVKVVVKILEQDAQGESIEPVLCTFSVNDIIHFEALVIRLSDELVKEGKGKSIHLFRRAFALNDNGNTYESCTINTPHEVPDGYRIDSEDQFITEVEQKYWRLFWRYALDAKARDEGMVKNAQIEAPATRFVPDNIYRIVLEHDGGLRIDATKIPAILKGELDRKTGKN